jgi:hypothetical protein
LVFSLAMPTHTSFSSSASNLSSCHWFKVYLCSRSISQRGFTSWILDTKLGYP